MPSCVTPLRIAVALDGAGWHPAAWREPDARPHDLLTPAYWTDLVREAEAGKLDFVTIEDSLPLQSSRFKQTDERTDQVRGRLDALLVAARVAPLTSRIGLIPTVSTTSTEPFHISKSVATLDYVSTGRAGWRPQVGRPHEASLFGRRDLAAVPREDLFTEAADSVEVVRRLWDSWQDDAIVKDVATGRFVDTERLHYIDFEGRFFSVKGPSITPRPPQGQPVVAALAHIDLAYRFAAASSDLVFVTPKDADDVKRIVGEVRAAEAATGRTGEPLKIFADLVVLLDDTETAAQQRKARLDEWAGAELQSDAGIFVGTPAALARQLRSWLPLGLSGFRLRPGALPHDLRAITGALVADLRANDAFRRDYDARTLRALLGLPRPANRYQPA
jgi:alkanesulfonate monooxygenase SsuD/methylene tetrahydromethanopterin reductase-like flavin-dependent oxidoreductase (luciferase family)